MENILKQNCDNKFTNRLDIRKEYYEGCENDMTELFISICNKKLIKNIIIKFI
jgi:hypothetical protein